MNENKTVIDREGGLSRSLTSRQLTMIGIGGAIGTGLFMGSGIAIGYAGPGVILSYIIAAFIAVIMMFSLSEMAVVHPTAGSFGTYAEMYLNPWAGFLIRYTYWAAQVIAIGGEAVAVGLYMQYWFPSIPVWLWTLGFGIALVLVNSRSVSNFGQIEYWFAMIKVVAIVLFIVFGVSLLFGIGHSHSVGFHHYTDQHGFLPNGFKGVWMAVLMAIFSFYGVEIVAVTAGESKDPKKAIPKAMKSMVLRLFLFYILSLGIIVAVIPWMQAGAHEVSGSPFVKVFESSGVRYAAGIMNFVILTAALSSMNTNLYLTSRMLFSLSRGDYAPKSFGKLSKNGTPVTAIFISSAGVLIATVLSMYYPDTFNKLFGISIFGGILVWLMILISHLRFRKTVHLHYKEPLPVKAPLFPFLQWVGILLLSGILITMAFSPDWNSAWKIGVPWVILVSIGYWIQKRRKSILYKQNSNNKSAL
ncbi:amino acid permease [Gottfriedia acidiceleris]|uniref:amino acid permease n=1 Tax=Gottfriedia acidiceleris TaxID=371036 RepID=UPI002FFF0B45